MSSKKPSESDFQVEGSDLAELRAQLDRLTAENKLLRQAQGLSADAGVPDAAKPHGSGKLRAVLAFFLVFIGLILVPVATVGAWANAQLTDTERFVSTFAPIASDPDVQQFVIDEVNEVILDQVDIDATVHSVFSGLSELDIPSQASAALLLLERPAADGIKTLIYDTISQVVRSEQFADVWRATLVLSHETAIGVINGDPDLALQLNENGTLSLQLGPLIESVKAELSAHGLGFVNNLPQVDYAVELMQSDSLILIRAVYSLATLAGVWLPWLALLFIGAGVAVAKKRVRATMWAGVGLAAVSAMILSGIGIGKWFVTMALSPEIMPIGASSALYELIVTATTGAITALLVLSIFIAVFAWFAGASRPAEYLRSWFSRAAAELAAWGDRRGVGTGRFGEWMFRNKSWVMVLIAVGGALIIMLSRPLAMSTVWAVVIWVLILILLVVLLGRDPIAIAKVQERFIVDDAEKLVTDEELIVDEELEIVSVTESDSA